MHLEVVAFAGEKKGCTYVLCSTFSLIMELELVVVDQKKSEDGVDSENLPDTSLSADRRANPFSIQFDYNFLRPQNTSNVLIYSAYK